MSSFGPPLMNRSLMLATIAAPGPVRKDITINNNTHKAISQTVREDSKARAAHLVVAAVSAKATAVARRVEPGLGAGAGSVAAVTDVQAAGRAVAVVEAVEEAVEEAAASPVAVAGWAEAEPERHRRNAGPFPRLPLLGRRSIM
eukprot:7383707-Prymnesium_polylepis.1